MMEIANVQLVSLPVPTMLLLESDSNDVPIEKPHRPRLGEWRC